MKHRRIASMLAVLGSFIAAGAVYANILLRIPDDIEPPLYLSNVTPFIASDGTVFAIHNGEWAALAFIRRIEDVPPDSNLLGADFSAIGKPLTVDGFAIFETPQDRVPIITETRGLGAVPVWFVNWDELQAAIADRNLTRSELEAMPSLLKGSASYFQEQNHFTTHKVSHLAAIASGTLEDGRSFSLQAVEVDLKLVQAQIVFK